MVDPISTHANVSTFSDLVFNSSSLTPSLSSISSPSITPDSCVLSSAASAAITTHTEAADLASSSVSGDSKSTQPQVVSDTPTAVSTSSPRRPSLATPSAPSLSSSAPPASTTAQPVSPTRVATTEMTSAAAKTSSSVSSIQTSSSRPANNDAAPPSDQAPSTHNTTSTPDTSIVPHTSSPPAPPATSAPHTSSSPKPAPPASSAATTPKPAPSTAAPQKPISDSKSSSSNGQSSTPSTAAPQKPISDSKSSSSNGQSSTPTSIAGSNTSKPVSSSSASSSKSGSSSSGSTAKTSSTAATTSGSHVNATAAGAASTRIQVVNSLTSHSLTPTFTTTIGGPVGIVNSDSFPSPTSGTLSGNHEGFFDDHGKVAGTFVPVALVALAILAIIPWLLRRYRRRNHDSSRELSRTPYNRSTMSQVEPSDDLYYRRQSQIISFSNSLSQGAGSSRVGRPGTADGSDDTHHSSEPILGGFVVPPSRAAPQGYNASKARDLEYYSAVTHYPETKTLLPILPELSGLPKRSEARLPRVPPASHAFSAEFINTAIGRDSVNRDISADLPPPNTAIGRNSVNRDSVAVSTDLPPPITAIGRNSLNRISSNPAAPPIPPKSPARQASIKTLPRPILSVIADARPSSKDDEPLRPPNPFADPNAGKQAAASIAETSPSIYPPSLPASPEDDEKESEEIYWRSRGFENVVESPTSTYSSSSKPTSLTTPTHGHQQSSLGLKFGPTSETNSSQSSFHKYGPMVTLEEENELVKNLDPSMEPSDIHRGSTAPIRMPSAWNIRGEGRYPLLTTHIGRTG
ncbi:hypothetical protein M422DRAFT_251447 [Sphaerobolus stellatus SS14]|uniref:Uncharacterized protein n=1 Tax=Sphaerobolus stellatus (strain SS14) TaxID=990650 RepID=A0A0C9W2L0_SPHS4|nr:hypothetical protein M422DRAFT_251447 [Sphaerobolus stellatus SS14]